MQVPSLNGFELVLPCRPSRTFRLPDFVRHLPRVQKRLETGFVRMRDVVRILVEPVRPWFLDAVLTEVDLTDDQDVRGSERSAFNRRMSRSICWSSRM